MTERPLFAGCPNSHVRAHAPLCLRQHATEQYGSRQLGHLYFATLALQTTHFFTSIEGEGRAPRDVCACSFGCLPAAPPFFAWPSLPACVPGKYAYRYAVSERVVKLIKTCGINKSRSFSTLLNNHGTIGENANRREQPVTSTAPLTES